MPEQPAHLPRVLRGTANVLRSPLRQPESWRAGSPYTVDLDQADAGPEGTRAAVHLVIAYAGLAAAAVATHLNGMAATLEAEGTVFAPLALARVAGEGAATGAWLLDPERSTRERITRAYAIRVDGLRRSCRLTTGFSLPEAQQVRQVERLQSALDQAAALGLDVHTESGPAEEDGSEPARRVVGLKLTVKREQIHTQALAEAGLADLAAGIYPVLSDVVHTTPNLLTIMDTGAYPIEQPEVTHIETAVYPETIEAAVMFAILPALHLAERHAAYLGHRTREVQSWRVHALAQILGDGNESPAQRS